LFDRFDLGGDLAAGFLPRRRVVLSWCLVIRGAPDDMKHHGVVTTQIFCIFNPKIGEDEPILTHIFQRG